jgi:hypothetical protein
MTTGLAGRERDARLINKFKLPVLLELDEGGLAGVAGRAVHAVFRCVRSVGRVHARLWSARGPLVGAPQICEVQRVGAYRGHFFETNFHAAFYTFGIGNCSSSPGVRFAVSFVSEF